MVFPYIQSDYHMQAKSYIRHNLFVISDVHINDLVELQLEADISSFTEANKVCSK